MPSAMLHALETVPPDLLVTQDVSFIAQEAARYAVLRRMGSAIRHQIAGALQPVTMIASLVERRVQAQVPNVDALRRNCGEMTALARSASAECVALMGWLAPQEGEQVALNQGVADCLHLLTTELSFRGFTVVDASQEVEALVARQSLRTLLPACLMALTDACEAQAQVRISSHADGAAASLALSLTQLAGASADAQPAKAYRPVTWRDVEALAQAEGVRLQVDGQGAQLHFSLAQPAPEAGAELRWG